MIEDDDWACDGTTGAGEVQEHVLEEYSEGLLAQEGYAVRQSH